MHSLYLDRHDAFLRWSESAGSGPLAVWLPGLGMPSAGNFLDVATDPALPPMRSVFVDPLGFGLSDAPVGPVATVSDLADCVADLLDHLGRGPATVVGYSMGGSVGIELACRRPDLVSRLIVAEANLHPGGGVASRAIAAVSQDDFREALLPQFLAELRREARDGDAVAAFIAGAWGRADPAALHGAARALVHLPDDFYDRFCALNLPRLYVIGSQNLPQEGDPPAPDAVDPEVLRAKGIEVRILEGRGHELMLADPSGFARLIASSLRAD